jgi:hypothetical protein
MALKQGYSPAKRYKPTPKPQPKTECQRDPNSVACLEEQLSGIRSQTAVWDLSPSSTLGKKITELQNAIKKNLVML